MRPPVRAAPRAWPCAWRPIKNPMAVSTTAWGSTRAPRTIFNIDCEGVPVVMAPEYVPLLDQATLDYIEMEPGQFHFIFLNPKDSGYCPAHDGLNQAGAFTPPIHPQP